MIGLIKKIFKRRGVDKTIYACITLLVIYGIIMIGSASVGQTASKGATYATVNMIKQGIFVGIGAVMMIFLARTFKEKWINITTTWIIYVVGLFSMVLCLAFGVHKGSYAWITLPGGIFTIQPAEFMKIGMILFLAFHFGEIEEFCQIPKFIKKEKREELQKRKAWYCVFRPILACGVVFGVGAFVQKDLGSSLILAFICMMMFFLSPRPYYTNFKKFFLVLGLAGGGLLVILGLAFLKSYQLDRILIWKNPLSDPLNKGYQLVNALIAFSYGGLFGKGFGASTQKYGYIPEGQNDFIIAIIYEELGLVGFLLVLIPYCIIIFKLLNYGTKVKSTKSKLVLYGTSVYFFAHLIVNVGGVSGAIPMTGVPLLLISSGGSSTLAAMISIGICQSIIAKYHRDELKEQI